MYGPRIRSVYDLGRGDGAVEIELGPFHDEPAAVKAYARWFSDNCVRSFLCSPYPIIESVEAESLKSFASKPDEMFWPIHANGGLIGTTSLFDMNRNHRRAELGIVIGESDWWGRGVATISEMLLSDYAFGNIVAGGLNKVTARVLDGNDGSRGALEKCGFPPDWRPPTTSLGARALVRRSPL